MRSKLELQEAIDLFHRSIAAALRPTEGIEGAPEPIIIIGIYGTALEALEWALGDDGNFSTMLNDLQGIERRRA